MSRSPKYAKGDNVIYSHTGKIGTINRVIIGEYSATYRVTIDGRTRTIPEEFLELHIDVEEDLLEKFVEEDFGDYEDYRLFETWLKLSRPIESNLYSYFSSKTIFNPHQFKPLHRFLSSGSDERLYIADEVGVGKTIESGIILNELFARGQLDNSTPLLIVCPNSLGPKWINEMKDRFNIQCHLHNGNTLEFTLKSTLDEGIFPQRYMFSVVSLQLLRHRKYFDLLRQLDASRHLPIFGIIIIDEAHHMRNPETDSNEVGNILSNMTERLLMLSATPLNLRSEDLYNQLHILNSNIFPDITTFETLQRPVRSINRLRNYITEDPISNKELIHQAINSLSRDPIGKTLSAHPIIDEIRRKIQTTEELSTNEKVRYQNILASLSPLYHSFTRTRKREALEHQIHREAWHVPIELSDEELVFIDDLIQAVIADYLRRGGNPIAIGFISNIYRRMASSCIPAMRPFFEWAIKENITIVSDERTFTDEFEDDSHFKTKELTKELKDDYIQLLNKVKIIEKNDNKYLQFKEILEKILENEETPQVMIFAFFIRTLEYLYNKLVEEGYRVGIIHGEIPLTGTSDYPGRYEIMDSFKNGEFDILLSSEVGGEGLDFQYCKAIINYDLPYNPMRIEQRIGRIDRFGQKAQKIIISNLFIQNTVDEEIYDRLYKRIRIVEDGVGTFEPIIGKQISDIQNQLLSGKLTEEQKEELSKRVEEAVEAAKIQMEIFEENKKELLSDDFVSQQINSQNPSSYITPQDAIIFSKKCVSLWSDCTFREYKDNRGELNLSPVIKTEIEKFLRKPLNHRGYPELAPLLLPNKRLKVIFDGRIANEFPSDHFLPPTGYWTKFLTRWLEENHPFHRLFKLVARGREEGMYIIFLYEIRIEGLRPEIELLGISIDVKTKMPAEISLSELKDVLELEDETLVLKIVKQDIHTYFDQSRNYLESILENKRNEFNEENKFRIDSRITALRKSSEKRIENFNKRIENHIINRRKNNQPPDETYLRLTNARIDKEEEKLSSKIDELQNKRELTMDYNLESIIILNLIP